MAKVTPPRRWIASWPASASAERPREPSLGGPLRVGALGRTAALRPRPPEAFLDLSAVRQAVLRKPDRATLTVDPDHLAGSRPDLRWRHLAPRSRDISGTCPFEP